MNDSQPASDAASTPQADQLLPYTDVEIETMTTEDAKAGKFLTTMLVCTFCYTIVVGGYVIYWSLN
ncbi:MAG: hypothetical protein K0U86_16560 [Planctomycetes bacterium]|nr:hypothetical protein [Planctomycetota bacterium]MCH9726513.1 hypothetical protein [Planctomycetota bacterium]MCH9778322.1 hypothetical protein [Planctomycetota bacterium]MCH9792416.1 hypothetical protein [Planctomycetota bacterium]MDF1746134.1 hypothetical protein [Gimesia sp.]